jgi:hypothetical protein
VVVSNPILHEPKLAAGYLERKVLSVLVLLDCDRKNNLTVGLGIGCVKLKIFLVD